MWEMLQKILEYRISPNACLFLFSVRENVSCPYVDSNTCVDQLVDAELISYEVDGGVKLISITDKGHAFIIQMDNYFTKAKKKTNIQLLGKDFSSKIDSYRELFPSGKLPSGVPARNNVKALGESFRWFFESYDYTWDEILAATKMYVNEYKQNDYLYMMTSQYFISKQDKHRVKKSALADYCDMVRDGVTTEEPKYFKDKVV